MTRLFSIAPEILDKLTPQEAVQAFRHLLCAEAERLGISSLISVSAAITTADGGIDAIVETSAQLSNEELISSHNNRYQIKTGDFKPWQEAVIKSELFGQNPPAKENLGEAICKC